MAGAHTRNLEPEPNPLWERACSRWRQHIQHECRLPHRYREQAHSYKVRVRRKCSNYFPAVALECLPSGHCPYNDQASQLTVSIGLTTLQPDDTLHTLLSRTDHAMYRARQSGRNRTCVEKSHSSYE